MFPPHQPALWHHFLICLISQESCSQFSNQKPVGAPGYLSCTWYYFLRYSDLVDTRLRNQQNFLQFHWRTWKIYRLSVTNNYLFSIQIISFCITRAPTGRCASCSLCFPKESDVVLQEHVCPILTSHPWIAWTLPPCDLKTAVPFILPSDTYLPNGPFILPSILLIVAIIKVLLSIIAKERGRGNHTRSFIPIADASFKIFACLSGRHLSGWWWVDNQHSIFQATIFLELLQVNWQLISIIRKIRTGWYRRRIFLLSGLYLPTPLKGITGLPILFLKERSAGRHLSQFSLGILSI